MSLKFRTGVQAADVNAEVISIWTVCEAVKLNEIIFEEMLTK